MCMYTSPCICTHSHVYLHPHVFKHIAKYTSPSVLVPICPICHISISSGVRVHCFTNLPLQMSLQQAIANVFYCTNVQDESGERGGGAVASFLAAKPNLGGWTDMQDDCADLQHLFPLLQVAYSPICLFRPTKVFVCASLVSKLRSVSLCSI